MVQPGWTEWAAAVWSTAVVVATELREHRSQVSFIEDQHTVGEFWSGGQYEPLGEAVRPQAARRDLYERIAADGRRVDVLCANAAWRGGPLAQITEKHLDLLLDVNVKGTVFTVQKALPLMNDHASAILSASFSCWTW
jgi:NAD(P)-dependent dehydrogenase (short-subunit alcohol dehydrogenase family)